MLREDSHQQSKNNLESTIFESEYYFNDYEYDTLLPRESFEDEMELVDCNIYRYNNSIEQELEPTEVDDLSGVSWPHSENEEINLNLNLHHLV